jgi:hypothetical protein
MSNYYDVELRCEVQAIVGIYADTVQEALDEAETMDISDIEITNLIGSEALGIKRTTKAS